MNKVSKANKSKENNLLAISTPQRMFPNLNHKLEVIHEHTRTSFDAIEIQSPKYKRASSPDSLNYRRLPMAGLFNVVKQVESSEGDHVEEVDSVDGQDPDTFFQENDLPLVTKLSQIEEDTNENEETLLKVS